MIYTSQRVFLIYVCITILQGGSLIAPDVILTAAHCAGGEYKAVIGRYDLSMTDGDVVRVKREVPHPRYDPE
jgi:trypsin